MGVVDKYSIKDAIKAVSSPKYDAKSVVTDSTAPSDLELEIEDTEVTEPVTNVDYSLEQHLMAQNVYGNTLQDITEMWDYGVNTSTSATEENEYFSPQSVSDTESMLLSYDEVEELGTSIQLAALSNTTEGVSWKEKEKMDWWIKENPALWGIFQKTKTLTQEVNYAPPK